MPLEIRRRDSVRRMPAALFNMYVRLIFSWNDGKTGLVCLRAVCVFFVTEVCVSVNASGVLCTVWYHNAISSRTPLCSTS